MQIVNSLMPAPPRPAVAGPRTPNNRRMNRRRALLQSAGGLAAWPMQLPAQQRRSLSDPLRLGVDPALMQSGLGPALQRGFGRDTGVAVQLVASASLPLLEALDRGELDAALANAPEAEAKFEAQGLVHDRREVARGEFVLVGPAGPGRSPDPAGLAGAASVTEALVRLAEAARAQPGTLVFLSAGDGSGTHLAEQALWRQARIAPETPWYRAASPGTGFAAQVAASRACALVERGAWTAAGAARSFVLLRPAATDRAGVEPVHVMRAFRVSHPAAKIFIGWIAGPPGRRIVAAQPGYRTPP